MTEETATELPPIMDQREVASLFGVSKRTIERWRAAADNPIPFMIVGGKIVFDYADVKAWGYRNAERIRNADPKEK